MLASKLLSRFATSRTLFKQPLPRSVGNGFTTMASVGPAPPLSPPTLRSVAAPTHLTPPSPLQLPSSYRTPSPIQIELELEDEVHVTARAGLESSPKRVGNRPLAAAGVDIGSMFDLAQRIELTGVIDMPFEKVPIVAAGGGAGSPLKEKKACTKACANCKKAGRLAATL